MEVWWLALSLMLTVVVTLVFAILFVRHYEDPRERTCLTTTVSALAISCTLFCVFLIPVDIYTVSSSLNGDGSQTRPELIEHTGQVVKWFYYALYIVLLALAFFVLPFTYFYYEEGVGTDDGRENLLPSGSGNSSGSATGGKSGGSGARKSVNATQRGAFERRCSAFKYTLGFAVVFAVLLTLGLVLRTTHGDGEDWKSKLSHSFSAGDAIITFCVATLACLGVFSWVVYGGYGLAAVPIRMMQKAHNDRTLLAEQQAKGSALPTTNKTASGVEDIEMSLASVQEQIKFLKSKYDLTSNDWSIKDKNEYRKLKSKETELLARQRRKEAQIKAGGDGLSATERCDKCWNAMAPLRIVVGVVLLLVALLIFVSLLLSVIDKLKHSTCGAGCGYTMDKPEIVNPLDVSLVGLGKVFPLDYIAFGAMVVFMFLCAVAGMVALGIRLIGFKLWSVRPGHTMPNALLMGSWILMFVALALNLEILTFTPQYATFGAQYYMHYPDGVNATADPTAELVRSDCTVEMSDTTPLSGQGTQCVMSQVARFIQLINIQLPFFGVILFFANLVWLTAFFVFLTYIGCVRRGVDHAALKEDAIDDMFYSED